MEIMVRPMMPGDWTVVSRIYQGGMDTNIATFQTTCPTFEEWDNSHMKECRLVAVLDGNVVGWAALTPVSNRCVYAGVAEVSIYVDDGHMRIGIGETLLNELIDLSEKNDLWMLQSSIMRENTASIRLHEKCGFRMVGYRERIGRDRYGKWRDNMLMERRSPLDVYNDEVSCACG